MRVSEPLSLKHKKTKICSYTHKTEVRRSTKPRRDVCNFILSPMKAWTMLKQSKKIGTYNIRRHVCNKLKLNFGLTNLMTSEQAQDNGPPRPMTNRTTPIVGLHRPMTFGPSQITTPAQTTHRPIHRPKYPQIID